MGCHRRISRRGPDRLRPNEMNLFAPNLRRRAAHLGGTVLRLLDNINTSSSGVEASRFWNSECAPLFWTCDFLKMKNGKKKFQKTKTGAQLFYCKGGS